MSDALMRAAEAQQLTDARSRIKDLQNTIAELEQTIVKNFDSYEGQLNSPQTEVSNAQVAHDRTQQG